MTHDKLDPNSEDIKIDIPDSDVAVEFLQRWQPGGPWVLTALEPNGKGAPTRTFDEANLDELHRWLENYNGMYNIYFHVNSALRALTKKALRTDIASVDWLHVDIDPRAGEDIEVEQARALGMLTDKLPRSVPPPTFIVFSGGGYQAFWKLEEPIPVDGDLAKAEDAKRYNQQLELLFGADNCHNIDRIMRLPGTVNIPNAIKRKKGRVPVLAALVSFNDNIYPLDTFTPAPASETTGPLGRGSVTVQVSDKIERIADLADLDQWGVSDRAKTIIAKGEHPDEPLKDGKDTSRSGWLWDVLCHLARCGVPHEIILGIITDPNWPISAHIQEKTKPVDAARKQIARAATKVANEPPPVGTLEQQILIINRNYFAALSGGKVRWWRENEDNTLESMDKAAFTFELATTCYRDDNGKIKPTAPVWMGHELRRYYSHGFILDPHSGHDGPAYNLWRGFSVEPEPGDWSLMREHIVGVLAAGNEDHAEYIIRWTAWSFQNPATPPRVALVFRGGEGVGKGMFASALVKSFGVHGMRIQNMLHLVGKFNAHLRHLCLLFADEAIVPNSDSEGALKGLITEPTIPIEAKGVDVVNADNHLHVIMATNNEWAVPASADARRFAVFDVSDHRKGDYNYFRALDQQMRNGGLAAMLSYMLSMDLAGFDPEADRPETEALARQKDLSLPEAQMVVHNMLREGEVPCDCITISACYSTNKGMKEKIFVATRLLAKETQLGVKGERSLSEALRVLAGKDAESERQYLGEGYNRRQYRGFWLPSLEECRRRWEAYLGRSVVWPPDVTTWALEITPGQEAPDKVHF